MEGQIIREPNWSNTHYAGLRTEGRMKRTSDDQSVMVEFGSRLITKICSVCSSWRSSHLKEEEEEDRISNLPDHILVSILSLMITEGGRGEEREIDQVVRTSILSRRWRFLWKYSLKSLLTFTFKEYDYSASARDAVYMKFVNRVNHILALPLGDTIDEFNLKLELDHDRDKYKPDLQGWIDFVFQKRVKRLNINLGGMSMCFNRFTLDDKVIRNHNMYSLVSLCLVSVDVTGKLLEYILAICGSLEHLSISRSETLFDLTVSGPSLKLKYLNVDRCSELKHLYIRDVNLVSLEYQDVSGSTVVIENTPHLLNARLGHGTGTAQILGYLPHLQTLVLIFSYQAERLALEFPKLKNLMQLELLIWQPTFSNAACASLLASSPSIRELKLVFELGITDTCAKDKAKGLEHPHECLEVVEIVGIIGCKLDTEVALYIIENTSSLKTVLVDTSQLSDKGTRERARATAIEHLGTRLSHTTTKFVLK